MASIYSSTGSSNVNYNRITGLASGLDIEGLIENLMKAERAPLDKIKQKKQLAEWRKEQYRSINAKVLELRTAYFDNVNLASNLKSTAAFKTFSTSSSDSNKVSLTTTGDSRAGTHIVSVSQIATAAKASSLTSAAVKASNVDISGYDESNNTLTIAVNGIDFDLTLTDASDIDSMISDIQNQINSKTALKNRVYAYKSEDGKLAFKTNIGMVELSGTALDSGKIGIASGTDLYGDIYSYRLSELKGFEGGSGDFTYDSDKITFRVNGKDISVGKDQTVADLIKAVNSSGAGVTMEYNSFTGEFSIVSAMTGSGTKITLEDTNGTDFLAKSGLLNNITAGTDARYKIDGVEGISSVNGVVIDGVGYNFKGVTTSDVTVSVTANMDSVVNTIKGFVNKYNELLDFVNKKLKEEKYRDFAPLTNEEKKAMEDSDIKLWEEKAKSGLIKGDPIVSSLVSDLRIALSGTVVGNSYNILASIGITTGTYLEGGKLKLNEEKLREELAKNPEEVIKLFNNKETNPDGSINYEKSGIAYKIDKVFDKYISTSVGNYGLLIQKSGTDVVNTTKNEIQTLIKEYEEQITELSLELIDIEDRYYKKFTALEIAMSKMSAQSGWLAGQLGGIA